MWLAALAFHPTASSPFARGGFITPSFPFLSISVTDLGQPASRRSPSLVALPLPAALHICTSIISAPAAFPNPSTRSAPSDAVLSSARPVPERPGMLTTARRSFTPHCLSSLDASRTHHPPVRHQPRSLCLDSCF
ncbi:hypothetical protein PaG_03856 [Moesziomyces aphidis]|uniref:Uncharacterized protein n=1 Tax=Moesziomyces aphidis TaxID=84754 RepID=W3VJT6_MOEAP|nr:hypothetical protein PaG_03856 [Moesziomyces aphidis]